MKTMECVICGIRLRHNGTREDTSCRDHRDATHPDVKKPIPLRDLFREVDDA